LFPGADVIAWTQQLALTGWARIAEPTRLRLRAFGVAGPSDPHRPAILAQDLCRLALAQADHQRAHPQPDLDLHNKPGPTTEGPASKAFQELERRPTHDSSASIRVIMDG
jgi:hypothetical protein